ncbi:NERD domain-containing protein [Bacillus sp. ISL-40]|uniref:nuclease-related domain-containing protein n=1 Tax=unclassified Bacillus (in: firmicutes) TaxID=185979 RepID=UPI001BEB6766|nr:MULTISPECIES: nuclease-related domain-containing protein [unclassified Bacillus (in: firmicutes)]MBT2698316.1 NERD domain-containing protein [Bacillus sp. ISL-40]MBT2724274.1 NERD domain-containing protein [Bacillus sp. ISL-46]MBT2742939.1 NERD domain-containing protein [Bacillus sp. ISL-77]
MIVKPRTMSKEYRTLLSLNARMDLSPKDKKHLVYLEKGYQGELKFDRLTMKLENELYIINDLCLEQNKSFIQIDTLIISQHTVYPYEVKNYEGDYRYELGNFYPKLSKDEIRNPFHQLNRSKSLLRPLLKNLGFYLPIEGDVAFVNKNFTLYQAPLNEPIIHPTQLNSLMQKLNGIPSKLTNRHKMLADQLILLHQTDSPYTRFPPYSYGQLQKGPLCADCHSLITSVVDNKIILVCDKCGHEELVDSVVLRCVEELVLLFPDLKITTNLVHDWCGVVGSRKTIRRILMQNYKSVGERQHRYFE